MGAPKAPAGLGAAGRRLWREVTADFELEADGVRLLAEVCRSLDELDRLSRAFAAAEVMTTGSAGQPVANPLLAEIRAHRLMLSKLLAALALPDEQDVAPLTATQERASKAARARWGAYALRYGDGPRPA